MDQGSTMKRSAVHNFAPTVTKFCVMWEGQALPHDTKFGNSRCEIVGRRVIFIWSLIHGLRWSGLIKAEPGGCLNIKILSYQYRNSHYQIRWSHDCVIFIMEISITGKTVFIWIRSRSCGCLDTWFCYQLIAKPGKKTATVPWPDLYKDSLHKSGAQVMTWYCIT